METTNSAVKAATVRFQNAWSNYRNSCPRCYNKGTCVLVKNKRHEAQLAARYLRAMLPRARYTT